MKSSTDAAFFLSHISLIFLSFYALSTEREFLVNKKLYNIGQNSKFIEYLLFFNFFLTIFVVVSFTLKGKYKNIVFKINSFFLLLNIFANFFYVLRFVDNFDQVLSSIWNDESNKNFVKLIEESFECKNYDVKLEYLMDNIGTVDCKTALSIQRDFRTLRLNLCFVIELAVFSIHISMYFLRHTF